MATAEYIVEIETALRRRFFQYVPKVEKAGRVGWTEENHDDDRLSRALAGFALVGMCAIDDALAASAITDGTDDGGIDALYFNRAGSKLVFVQSKFKRNGASPTQADNLKTINGVRAICNRQFDQFNPLFQVRLDEIEEALDFPGVQIEVVLAYLGSVDNLSPHVADDLNRFCAEMNRLTDRMSWRAVGHAEIRNWLLAEQTPPDVDVQITLENWSGVRSPRMAVYGQITAAALADLVTNHGTALFQRNLRHYLGSIGVNIAIERTVRRRPADFFYLNNGLTAVAERITPGAGNEAKCNFGLRNISIVNGAQTAGAIANAALNGQISPNAKVLITVIELANPADDFGFQITRARNHQSLVRGIDFAALDPKQEELRRQLALLGITYYYRPAAEARMRRADAFTLEEAIVSMACLLFPVLSSEQLQNGPTPRHAVNFVVTAKNEVGRLWDQDGAYYSELFGERVSGLRTWRIVQVFRLIDQILADTERSEGTYQRKMFFRHGRFFVMAFVAQRCVEVLRRMEVTLSPDDTSALSQQTNLMSELIYAESASVVVTKGYLAVFRNLTDCQQLADGVLRRLSQSEMLPDTVA